MIKKEPNLPNQPALVPLYGGTEKKVRPLDRDVVTIGRARGCDLILDGGDVSTLHCMVYRSADGYQIRDCGSRTGTRINGAGVRNQLLADEDVLNVGPFSFRLRLPAQRGQEPQRGPAREHLQHSRRNLATLALSLRSRCRELGQVPAGSAGNGREAALMARLRTYDQRLALLEEAERELEKERFAFYRDRDGYQAHLQKVEDELVRRLNEAEETIHRRWQEFQHRCAEVEQRLVGWEKQLQGGERVAP